MRSDKTVSDYIKAASEAHADLNMFEAIAVLCESSLFSTASYGAEERIVKLCRREEQRCLRAYEEDDPTFIKDGDNVVIDGIDREYGKSDVCITVGDLRRAAKALEG